MNNIKNMALALVVGATLTACGGSSSVRLEGKRIDVVASKASVKEDRAAMKTAMVLSPIAKNSMWQQVGGNSAHAVGHLDIAKSVRKVWRKSLSGGAGGHDVLLNPPVAENGVIFAINTDLELYAIDEAKGKIIWDTEIELEEDENINYGGGLAVAGGKIFITTGSGEIFSYDAKTGKQIWKANVAVPLRAAPTIAYGMIYIVSHNNSLFALNAEDGALKWTHNGIDEGLAILGGASAAVAEGMVVVPYSSGEIYVLDAQNGRYMWHDSISFNVGGDVFSSLVDVEASPIIANGIVYAVNHNGQFAAFVLKNGRRLWEREISATQTPWVSGNVLFVVTDNSELVAINRRDGLIRWVTDLKSHLTRSELEDANFWSGPVLAGGRLIIVSSIGYAISVDPYSGKVVKVVNMPDGISLPPIVSNQSLIFMTDDAEILSYK